MFIMKFTHDYFVIGKNPTVIFLYSEIFHFKNSQNTFCLECFPFKKQIPLSASANSF